MMMFRRSEMTKVLAQLKLTHCININKPYLGMLKSKDSLYCPLQTAQFYRRINLENDLIAIVKKSKLFDTNKKSYGKLKKDSKQFNACKLNYFKGIPI